MGRIDEPCNTSGCRHQRTQEFQPLCGQLANEKIDTCQAAAGLGKAGHKTEPYWVFTDGEDDGDRRGCRLGRERHREASACGDHRDPSANQVGRQHRQPIELILGPAVFDRHVFPLDIAL
jgi:hypothetical protein